MFASLYADLTAGLMLVDASHENQSKPMEKEEEGKETGQRGEIREGRKEKDRRTG